MPRNKTYTVATHATHPIIKVALRKGLTNVVVYWNHAMHAWAGWTFSSDEYRFTLRYARVSDVVKKINEYNPVK